MEPIIYSKMLQAIKKELFLKVNTTKSFKW